MKLYQLRDYTLVIKQTPHHRSPTSLSRASPVYFVHRALKQRLKEASTFDHPERVVDSQSRQQEALQNEIESQHGFPRFVDFRSDASSRQNVHACWVGSALVTVVALWLGH